MASQEAMQAALDIRRRAFPNPIEYEAGGHEWWEQYRLQTYELFPHIVTLDYGERSFDVDEKIPRPIREWLTENVGPEASLVQDPKSSNRRQLVPVLGAWDWWYGSGGSHSLSRQDFSFLDANDAIAFKLRWR